MDDGLEQKTTVQRPSPLSKESSQHHDKQTTRHFSLVQTELSGQLLVVL